MMLKVVILLSLIRYVLVLDSHKYTNLFRTQRSCSNIEYYDRFQHKCQSFPGGGYLVIVDHSAKCTDGDTGLHTFNRNDFYYFCSPDGVMIGMCPTGMKFNDTLGRCVQPTDKPQNTIRIYDESENCNVMIPNCNKDGKFPVPSNCSFFYDCQRNNHNYLQYVYKCPYATMFHPDLHRCVTMTKCYVDKHDILDRFDNDYFPQCIVQGQFRTSRHCNLFYRCIPNMDGSFFQIRYECPPMMYYNVDKERCYMGYFKNCEYIPWDRIVKDFVIKHDLELDHSTPKHTTTISTLNTTITTSLPSSTTISFNPNETYSTTTSMVSTKKPRPVTKLTTKVTDSIETSSVTAPASDKNTDATDFQDPDIKAYTTLSQTDEVTRATASHTESTVTTVNHTLLTETSMKEPTESVTLTSRKTTKGYSSNETDSSNSTMAKTMSTSMITKLATISITNEVKQTTESTEATSLTSKQTTESTTEVAYSSAKPTSKNINGTSIEPMLNTTAPTTSKLTTENSTDTSNTSLQSTTKNISRKSTEATANTTLTPSPLTASSTSVTSPSQLPTARTTYSSRTSSVGSSDEYDSYEDFTWDDEAWYLYHSTSKIPDGYPTPSPEKPRAHFHTDSPPFDYPDSNFWDDSNSQEATKDSSNSTSTRISQNAENESSTKNYSSSTKPLSSHAEDSESSESHQLNSRPVRCYNNPQGGLTCDGVKGKAGGWFDLPGYFLRYRKRSGEDTTPDKKFNGQVNLRLRYPNAYKLEAYPKQKRRVRKTGQ